MYVFVCDGSIRENLVFCWGFYCHSKLQKYYVLSFYCTVHNFCFLAYHKYYKHKCYRDKMMLRGHSGRQIHWSLLTHRTQLLTTKPARKLLIIVSAITAAASHSC